MTAEQYEPITPNWQTCKSNGSNIHVMALGGKVNMRVYGRHGLKLDVDMPPEAARNLAATKPACLSRVLGTMASVVEDNDPQVQLSRACYQLPGMKAL